jgi:outer membrane receptor protein involved in Fe transport
MISFKNALRRATILAPFALGVALSTPAIAQETIPTPAPDDTSAEQTNTEELVVTGSRLRRDEFSSSSPVEIITRGESVLAGTASTAEILQGSTVTSGTQQVTNTFLGFVTEGGPGANTVSLRGLGAVRTLVLLNGRRLAPAGTRGQVAPADLNVLPSAMVERIEILKDGASSIYGSDAVAGVVNIITRNDIEGFTFEGFTDQTFEGGAEQYRASGAFGQTFDRGQYSVSLEYIRSEPLERGDRDWASCPTDFRFSPTTGAFLGVRNADGTPRCFPIGVTSGQGIAHDYLIAYGFFGAGTNRFTPNPGQVAGGGNLTDFQNVNALTLRPQANPGQQKEHIFSPVETWTGYANGSFDLQALGNAELYGELLYSRRESESVGSRQLSLDPLGFTPIGYYNGLSGFGFPADSPFFPTALRDAGYQAINPLIYFGNDTTSAEVEYLRASAGVRGDLGIKNWRYDGNLLFSKSKSNYTFESFIQSRLLQSLDVVAAPAGTPSNLVVTAGPGTVGAGGQFTCRVNIGNPNAACVPADLLTDGASAGNIPANFRNWVFRPVTGDTEFEQITGQFIIDGDLFKVPAGDVGFALGFEYRKDKLTDTPPIESRNRDLFNLSSSGITKGEDTVYEAFAEFEVPIFRNHPLGEELTFSTSGRYTDYDSFGSQETYKLGLSYTPINFLKFRGTHGTSFRAPGIFEQNLGGQSGFFGAGSDPCNDWQFEDPASNIYQNCELALDAALGAGNATSFDFATSGPEVRRFGGREGQRAGFDALEAETSEANTIGVIFQPDSLALSIAIDWFNIKISDQIDNFGTAILSNCYTSNTADFAANVGTCQLIAPRRGDGNLTFFNDPYVNIATQEVEGLDFNIRYKHVIGAGELTVTTRATRTYTSKFKLFPDDPEDNVAGFPGSPEWVGDITFRYDWKDWTFRYGTEYVGTQDGNERAGTNPGTANNNAGFDFRVDEYFNHSASVQFAGKNNWEITVGANNLFDEEPPTVAPGLGAVPRVGNSLLSSNYDYRGRSVFVNIVKSF